MFTGLVQQLGVVVDQQDADHGRSLRIDARGWSHHPCHGDSIAVNGCCLTVADIDDPTGSMRFDVIAQTLLRTTIGDWKTGDRVNLEHAMTAHALFGGHVVQGHVDDVATVRRIDTSNGEHRVHIELPTHLQQYILPQGSIAIDGVSLTIAAVTGAGLEVALIPTTLELTTLGSLKPGDHVNIETDCMARMVVQTVQRYQQSVKNEPAP